MNAGLRKNLVKKIFSINSGGEFEKTALEVFAYQSANNIIYKTYLDYLGLNPNVVNCTRDIPCLPVTMFKTHKVLTACPEIKLVFKSSGTTGMMRSTHYVADSEIYETSFLKCFESFYGDPEKICILALLPSYIERGDSSLVYMVKGLIEKSSNRRSGFYLDDIDRLVATLRSLEADDENTLLLGVSFALLNLAERHKFALKNTIIMETGGMKGKRREMIREELHAILKTGLGVETIHSEYGMTELLSQAYSTGEGIFATPPWMKIVIRDPYNPLARLPQGRSGGVNIIDLANIDSCAFIETADLGKIHPDGKFEILGRFDSSDIRGCNLMAE